MTEKRGIRERWGGESLLVTPGRPSEERPVSFMVDVIDRTKCFDAQINTVLYNGILV